MVLGFRLTHGLHRGSVLPKIAGQRTRGGMKLSAAKPKKSEMIIAGSFALLFLVWALWPGLHPNKQIEAAGAAVSFALTALPLARVYFRQRRLRHATLTVRPWPIRLGDHVETTFRSIPALPVAARLVCVEEATISSGKYEEKKHSVRFEQELQSWDFEIPRFGIPSFAVKSNRVRWLVRTVIDGEITADFELLVIPEIAP